MTLRIHLKSCVVRKQVFHLAFESPTKSTTSGHFWPFHLNFSSIFWRYFFTFFPFFAKMNASRLRFFVFFGQSDADFFGCRQVQFTKQPFVSIYHRLCFLLRRKSKQVTYIFRKVLKMRNSCSTSQFFAPKTEKQRGRNYAKWIRDESAYYSRKMFEIFGLSSFSFLKFRRCEIL